MKVSMQPAPCGIDVAIGVIGGKWKALILWELRDGAQRPGQLRRNVTGISEKMLIQQLRELEADGLIHREAYPEVPPRVEYSLTDFGVSLNEVLVPLCEWGERHTARIAETRAGAGCAVSS